MKYYLYKHSTGTYVVVNSDNYLYYYPDGKWYMVTAPVHSSEYYTLINEIQDFKESDIDKYMLLNKLLK